MGDPDVELEVAGKKGWFDFSNFPENHPLQDDSNKCVLGLFKDECNVQPNKEFVGLKSKMYSLSIEGGCESCEMDEKEHDKQ